jgi:5-methylcytosine-specific restriction endonuclease McrA
MRNLIAPPADPAPLFAAIVQAKQLAQRARLTGLAPLVQGLYLAYHNSRNNLESLIPTVLTEEQSDDLKTCYTGETQPLNALKAYIRNHHRDTQPTAAALCQYCGLSYEPSTMDHYLPKETFAEFSTLSHNLVPSCGRCNHLKGTAWLDANHSRRIVNFYFDTLPQEQFLFAHVQMAPAPVANFSLSNVPAAFGGIEAIIRNHFTKLDLLNRFREAAPAEFGELMIELGPLVQQQGIGVAQALLQAKAQQKAQAHSMNYWKVALYQAAAASEPFLNGCAALNPVA